MPLALFQRERVARERALLQRYAVLNDTISYSRLAEPPEPGTPPASRALCEYAGDLIVSAAALITSSQEQILNGRLQVLASRDRVKRRDGCRDQRQIW